VTYAIAPREIRQISRIADAANAFIWTGRFSKNEKTRWLLDTSIEAAFFWRPIMIRNANYCL
jgi:hypothetical protein